MNHGPTACKTTGSNSHYSLHLITKKIWTEFNKTVANVFVEPLMVCSELCNSFFKSVFESDNNWCTRDSTIIFGVIHFSTQIMPIEGNLTFYQVNLLETSEVHP
jgi:hypothetical protein